MAQVQGERIVAYLHPRIAEQVKDYADRQDRSVSWVAGQLIEAAMLTLDLEAV